MQHSKKSIAVISFKNRLKTWKNSCADTQYSHPFSKQSAPFLREAFLQKFKRHVVFKVLFTCVQTGETCLTCETGYGSELKNADIAATTTL